MADIVLQKVSKRYEDGSVAVREVSLTIADGERVILVGPSGCGKSTTLEMIAGLTEVSSGDLYIGGERVNDKPARERDLAMVFQSYALYPNLTVRENLAFPLRLMKLEERVIAQKVAEAARLLELTALLERRPSALSGGQRQRVAMGRALVRRPKAFLMDEPLSNLDAKLRVQMRTLLARLQRQLGTTTVYVTHDQTEAMTLADRIVVMRGGAVQQVGAPHELYERPANLFVAGFIGSPAMNFMPAAVEAGGVRTPLGVLPVAEPLRALAERTAGGVIAGVRPEALHDTATLDEPLRARSVEVELTAEVVESLGAEQYVYCALEGERAQAKDLDELAADAAADVPAARPQLVARLMTSARVREGQRVRLFCDAQKVHLFARTSGLRLAPPP